MVVLLQEASVISAVGEASQLLSEIDSLQL